MAEEDNKSGNAGLALGALAAGVVAGAIGGILLAPKSGAETRADIADTAEKIKHDITEQLSNAKEVTLEKYHSVVDSVVQKYQDTKNITGEEAGELKKELGKHYSKIKEAMES